MNSGLTVTYRGQRILISDNGELINGFNQALLKDGCVRVNVVKLFDTRLDAGNSPMPSDDALYQAVINEINNTLGTDTARKYIGIIVPETSRPRKVSPLMAMAFFMPGRSAKMLYWPYKIYMLNTLLDDIVQHGNAAKYFDDPQTLRELSRVLPAYAGIAANNQVELPDGGVFIMDQKVAEELLRIYANDNGYKEAMAIKKKAEVALKLLSEKAAQVAV